MSAKLGYMLCNVITAQCDHKLQAIVNDYGSLARNFCVNKAFYFKHPFFWDMTQRHNPEELTLSFTPL
jgi:hypothetical protein